MAKNTFATFGILAVLLMSLGMVSADVEASGVTLSITSGDMTLTEVNASDVYEYTVTVENNNETNLFFDFGTTDWEWNISGRVEIENEGILTFQGNLTIPTATTPATKSIILKVYEDNVATDILFDVEEEISISYYEAPVQGCTDINASNYDSSAEIDDGSCTYTACYSEWGVDKNGTLEISDFDINNLGKGDDEAWEYMDSIEIEVEIENTDNDEDVDDVEVQVIVWDDAGNDVTRDFEFDEDVITSIGRLKDDDQETVLFTIEEVPADVEAGDYFLYIVAYSDGEESEQCISEYDGDLYFEFSVESVDYEDAIVVKESELGFSVDTYCGEKNLEITIPVYNLYDEDEEKVLVNIYNSELGINEFQVIDDLNDGDNEDVSFFVSIPESLSKEKYDLDIYLHFDWDDDEDEYDEFAYEELNDKTSLRLNILGCKGPAPSMVPSLGSVVQEGTELIVKTLVTNNGEDNDFIISVSGYESWAELVSVTPETVNIKEGEFIEVSVILMPITSGMKSFKISATVGDDVFNQPVSVNVKEAPSAFGFSGLPLYLTAGIGGMLLLILLVLVVKISRRKPVKAQF